MTSSVKHLRAFAVLAVAICLISIIPVGDVSADSDDYYRYVIHPDGTVEGNYTPIGPGTDGTYTSVNNTNSGSWTWDEDGYGPFNSFYAAFDPSDSNRMICHLDPEDLTRSIDGNSISGMRYNIMWCLPTVYWLTDSSGNLILTDDPEDGGAAYAHTIDGHVYSYIGIGVYEASKQNVDGVDILTSWTGQRPTTLQTISTFREQANIQTVDTDGSGTNGHSMLWNFYQWQLYRFCSLTLMESWDSQAVVGNGYTYHFSDTKTSGNLDNAGTYAGTIGDSGNNSVKLLIENAWGSCAEVVDGTIVGRDFKLYISQSSKPTDSVDEQYNVVPSFMLPSGGGMEYDPSTEEQIWGIPTSTVEGTIPMYDAIIKPSGSNETGLVVGGAANFAMYGNTSCGLSTLNYDLWFDTATSETGTRLAFVFDDDPFQPQTHTVTFSTGSSTTIPSQIIESGQTALTPSNPTLEGYVFDCWSTSATSRVPYDFNTPVTQDLTLYAVWVETLVFTTTPTSQGTVSAVPRMAGTILCDAAGSRDYTSLLWDLGDGTLSTDNYVTHYYSEPGTYTVTLTTYNSQGADVTTFTVEVPEAPGGEGEDDVLLWVAIGLLALLIVIVVVTRLL